MRPEWWMMNQFPVHTTKPTEKIKGTLDLLRLAVPFEHTRRMETRVRTQQVRPCMHAGFNVRGAADVNGRAAGRRSEEL